MSELPTDLITPAQAATIGHVSTCSVWRWIRLGRLRAWKVGTGRLLVSQADVLSLIVPVAVRPPLARRDRNGQRLTAELDRQREERTRILLRLPLDGPGAA